MALGCWFVCFLSMVCGKQNDSHQVLTVTIFLKYGWVHVFGLRYLLLACPFVEKKLRKLENFRFFFLSVVSLSVLIPILSIFYFSPRITAAKKDQQELVRMKRESVLVLNRSFFLLSKNEMLKTSQVKLKCSIHFKCFLAKICHIPT